MNRLAGNVTALDRDRLVNLFSRSSPWGTLALSFESGVEVMLLAGGKVRSTFRFGEAPDDSAAEAQFAFEPHEETDLPQLGSSFPESTVAVLQALPSFGPTVQLPAALVDLRAFVARAREAELCGALTMADGDERAVALFFDGRIGAAFLEKGGRVWERADALRGIYRHSLDARNTPMHFLPLEKGVARALLGLALERRQSSGEAGSFNGISAAEGGFTFYCQGRAQLLITARYKGNAGRFGQLVSVPDLELPDDPPGWESRRFTLTLRGSDALNPMTELAMVFSDQYGSGGRRVLEAVRHGLTIEETATRLDLDLQSLKPWLEKLEKDGLIRLLA